MKIPALAQMSVDALLTVRDAIDKALNERAAGMRRQLDALGVLDGEKQPKRRGRPPGRQKAAKTHALKGTTAPVKYRGPNGEPWAGRGMKPRWLTAALAEGRSIEEFAVGTSVAARKKAPAKRSGGKMPGRKKRAA